MAVKYRDRYKTSVARRRNQRQMTNTEFIRTIAWPFGESEEITVWIAMCSYVPVFLLLASSIVTANILLVFPETHIDWFYLAIFSNVFTLVMWLLLRQH